MKLRLVKRGEIDDKKERKRSSSNQNQLRNQSTRSRNDSVLSGSSQIQPRQSLMHQSSQQQLIQSPSSKIISQTNSTTPNNLNNRDVQRYQQQYVKGQVNQFGQWDQRNQENYLQHDDSTTERGMSNNERNSMGSSSTSSNKIPSKVLAPRESNCVSDSMNQRKSEDQRRLEMEFTKAQEEIHRLRDVCEQLMKEAQDRMQYEEQVHNLAEENEFMKQQISDLQDQKANQVNMFRSKLQDNEQQLKRNIQEELVKLGSTFAKDREKLEKANDALHEEREDILRRNNELEMVCSQLEQKYNELEINYNQQHKHTEELWHENEDLRVEILKLQDQLHEVNNQGDNNSKEMYTRMCQLEDELTYIQGELARVQAENTNLERINRENIEINKIQTANHNNSTQLNELVQELKREQEQGAAQRELIEEMKQQIDNLETLIKTLAAQAKEKQRRNVFLEQSVRTLQAKLAPKLSILKKTFRLLMCDMHLKHLLTTERQQHAERIQQLKQLFQQSELEHKKVENQLERLTCDNKELSKKSLEFEQMMVQKSRRTEELGKVVEGKENEIDTLKKEIANLGSQNSRFNEISCNSGGKEQLSSEIKTLNREIELLQANNVDLQQQLRWEKVGKESQTQQLIMNNADIKSLQGQIEQFVTEISQLHIKEMQQTQEIQVLNQKISSLEKQQQDQISTMNIHNNNFSSSCMKETGQNSTAANNNNNINNNNNHICSLQLFNLQSENTLNTNHNLLNNNSNNFTHSKYENEECNIIKYSNKLNNLDNNGFFTQSDISPTFNQKNYNQADEIHRLSSVNYTLGQELLGLKAQLEISEGSLSSLKAQIVLVTSDNQILANRIKDLQDQQFADGNSSYNLKSKLEKEINDKRILQDEILQLQKNKKLVEEEVDKNTQDWSNKVKVLAQNFAIEKQSLEDRIKWYQLNGGKLWN